MSLFNPVVWVFAGAYELSFFECWLLKGGITRAYDSENYLFI